MKTLTGIWKFWQQPAYKPWIFPAALLLLTLGLSAFSISGTSIGVYPQLFNGVKAHDPNLLYGKPETVRSDEWLVSTAMTVAQSRQNFPRVNHNIGLGEDMSVVFDVPYRDWSTLFRPQNWAFFVLPLSVAFALKWWLLGIGVVIPLYFLILKFLPQRYFLASLLALSFIWSPFMQWWYQSITLAPVAYGAGILLTVMALYSASSLRRRVGLSLLLAYLFMCFFIVLYPPFQIMVAEVVAALVIGLLLEKGILKKRPWPFALSLGGAVILGGVLMAAFVLTRSQVVSTIIHTVYPGQRVVASGGFGIDRLLSGFVSFRLQFAYAAAHFYTNQSEGSSFIFLWPFLIIPSAYAVVIRWRRQHSIDWPLIMVHLLILFLLAHLFLPLSSSVTRLLGFSGILQSRALLGLGLLGLFQLVLVIRAGMKHPYPRWLALAMAALASITQVLAGLALARHNPGYLPHQYQIIVLALVVGVIVGLIVWGKLNYGVGLLVALGVFSTGYIHPLYHGLSPLVSTKLQTAIAHQESRLPGPWVVLDTPVFANYIASSGAPSYSGVYSYPQLQLWRRFDQSQSAFSAYDRYGFAIFTTDPLPDQVAPRTGDSFFVHYDACSASDRAIKHVLSITPATSPCLTLDQTLAYPKLKLYLYHLN